MLVLVFVALARLLGTLISMVMMLLLLLNARVFHLHHTLRTRFMFFMLLFLSLLFLPLFGANLAHLLRLVDVNNLR